MKPSVSRALSAHLLDHAGGHRRKVTAAFAEKRAAEYADAGMRRQAGAQVLARLLGHAREHVPAWSGILRDAGEITPQSARRVLAGLPVMRRDDIQRDIRPFLSSVAGPVVEDATGGSSGTPMRFIVDRSTQIARESSLMWADNLAGWEPGERLAMLWGADRDVKGARASLRLGLRWWIENRRWYNAFQMTEADMRRYHELMERFRPHLLVAYAGSVFEFARFLRENGLAPHYPARGIVSSAEMLSAPMRQMIEEVFAKPVFDRYGDREFGAIAAECPAHAGLHVNESDMIVEIDSPDPERVPGPVLITYLRNRAMPFIRYDTGDLGLVEPDEPCACGRTTLRLAPVVGRASDTIRTSSGKLIHGEYFTHLLYRCPGVRDFQFIQETPDSYRLLLTGDRAVIDTGLPDVEKSIREAVGASGQLAVEFVERIPVSASGKRRFTFSKVDRT